MEVPSLDTSDEGRRSADLAAPFGLDTRQTYSRKPMPMSQKSCAERVISAPAKPLSSASHEDVRRTLYLLPPSLIISQASCKTDGLCPPQPSGFDGDVGFQHAPPASALPTPFSIQCPSPLSSKYITVRAASPTFALVGSRGPGSSCGAATRICTRRVASSNKARDMEQSRKREL